MPKDQGGYALLDPKIFLRWQFATLFVRFLNDSASIPQIVTSEFRPFQNKHGTVLDSFSIFTFQMGSNVVWNTMPYLAWSARCSSLLKQDLPQPPPTMLAYNTALWHHCAFRNEHRQTYFCPKLIRAGILTVGDLLGDDSMSHRLAPSWRPIYSSTIQQLAQSQLPETLPRPDRYPAFPDKAHSVKWIDSKAIAYVSYAYTFGPRQQREVWQAWWRCNLPLDLKDFVYAAVWRKLPVGSKQAAWKLLDTHCPLDGAIETMQHSLLHCCYLPVAYDTIVKCFPDWDQGILGV